MKQKRTLQGSQDGRNDLSWGKDEEIKEKLGEQARSGRVLHATVRTLSDMGSLWRVLSKGMA